MPGKAAAARASQNPLPSRSTIAACPTAPETAMTERRTPPAGLTAPHRRPGRWPPPPAALSLPGARAAPRPRRCASATRWRAPGPWTGGAQVSQEPNYLLWAEQQNAAGGLNVKGAKRPIELISSDDRSDIETVRAHLREADGQRQGRPGPAALGQQRQLRRGAAGQPLRLPLPGAHRAAPAPGRDEAAVLLPDAAAAQADDATRWSTCSRPTA